MQAIKCRSSRIVTLQNRLLLFCFITSLGSALSSIASFLSIEHYFHSIILLSLALGAKTLSSAAFSYFVEKIIRKTGLRYSLLVSQVSGLLALVVLFLGFFFNSFAVTILGIMLTGIPSVFVSILITISLKVISEHDGMFRLYSGRRELLIGISLLLASILTPLLFLRYKLNTIFFIDALSYLFCIVLILKTNIRYDNVSNSKKSTLSFKLLFTSSKEVQEFMLKTSGALLLAGMLPLLASSSKIEFTRYMPTVLRQWLWSIEDITAISASIFYLLFYALKSRKMIEAVLMLSSVWLIIPLFLENNISIIASVVILCVLIDYSAQKFKDDLIISANNNIELINFYSAISQFQRNFLFFVSPILISLLLTYTSTYCCVLVLFLIQIVFYLSYRLHFRKVIVRLSENSM